MRAYSMAIQIESMSEDDILLGALGVVDLTFSGCLIVLVVFSTYANFVARVDTEAHPGWPSWMVNIDYSELKLKLIASIVAISAIKLLEGFMNLDHETNRDWRGKPASSAASSARRFSSASPTPSARSGAATAHSDGRGAPFHVLGAGRHGDRRDDLARLDVHDLADAGAAARIAAERAKREDIYGRFMDELARLYAGALDNAVVDYERLTTAYALNGRIALYARSRQRGRGKAMRYIVDISLGRQTFGRRDAGDDGSAGRQRDPRVRRMLPGGAAGAGIERAQVQTQPVARLRDRPQMPVRLVARRDRRLVVEKK